MKSFLNRLFYLLFLLLLIVSCKRNLEKDKDSVVQNRSSKEIQAVYNPEFINRKQTSKSENLTLASWNIQRLGRTKTPDDIHAIANLLRNVDIVAIQEVVAKDPAGAQAVAKIADELNRMGSKWDYQVSDPTKSPSGNISERYAFFWKTSKVSLIHRAYLDKELEKVCDREPFIAAFKAKGKEEPFYVINFHSRTYNNRPEEEIIHFIDYPERLASNRILLAGDFNLSEKHDVWKPFYRRGFKNAIQNQRTTLKRKCKDGKYLNHPIDNIYYTNGITKVRAESVDFVGNCENLIRAREISDHLPVFIEFKLEGK